jgi:small-conductance mechanosensitive channel
LTLPAAVDGGQAETFSANTFRRIFIVMTVLLVIGAPALWARYGGGMALSFIIKRTLSAMVEAAAVDGKKRSAAGIVLRFVLRYLLIAVAVYAIFKSSAMSLIGLCAGLSLPVGAVLIEAAYAMYGALRRGF